MKKIIKIGVWLFFLILVLGNIYIFIGGMTLSNEISRYEKEINRLNLENIDLEKKAYELSSLRHAASMAAQLSFTKKSQPLYLDNIKYALNR